MGPTARTAMLAAACVLALAAFVTTTSDGARWSWGGSEDRSAVESTDGTSCKGADCHEVVDREIDELPAYRVPLWLDLLSNLLLAALAAFLLTLAWRKLRVVRRARMLRGRRETIDPAVFVEPRPTEEELLADELAERLAALAGGSPRNAVVAAWIALESAAARAGIEPLETETPSEFTGRALAKYHLDPDALQRLADLYREARFSRHRLTEHHLTQARDCLTVLTDDLRRARPRTSGSSS